MFGINKCFGGSRWGVIQAVSSYSLALEVCEKLAEKHGGLYEPALLNATDDRAYLSMALGIDLTPVDSAVNPG